MTTRGVVVFYSCLVACCCEGRPTGVWRRLRAGSSLEFGNADGLLSSRTPQNRALKATSTAIRDLNLCVPRSLRAGTSQTDSGKHSRVKRVLVFGGTGRVGGSTIEWLRKMAAEGDFALEIAVAGRNKRRFDALQRVAEGSAVPNTKLSFVELDFTDSLAMREAISYEASSGKAWDLVIHTAGPFQRKKENEVLDACLEAGVAYVDVCDDTELALSAKRKGDAAAKAKDIPVLISTGIWPGVSALMAKKVVQAMEREMGTKPTHLDMNFFTAGTGGAGATILSATFLLLCEPVRVMLDGQQRTLKPWTSNQIIDFGSRVGKKPTYLLDQPEVVMCGKYLGVPNVESRFGTAPDAWNQLFKAIAILPANLLSNRDLMQKFAVFSLPIVRLVDSLVGSTNAMRVDATLEGEPGRRFSSLIVHDSLSSCVGQATAAFAMEVLEGRVASGVQFPVELKDDNVDHILARVKDDAIDWKVP